LSLSTWIPLLYDAVNSKRKRVEKMEKVEELDSKHFQNDVLESKKPTLVVFYMPWNPHYKKILPALRRLVDEFEFQIKFTEINIETAPDVAAAYNIHSLPTLKLFIDGRVVYTYCGFLLPQMVERELKDVVRSVESAVMSAEI
jgi:thioredoxin 1